MLLNERLYVSGQLDAFGRAARSRDRQEMLAILATVEVNDAPWVVDTILENPDKYGY